MSQKQKLYKTCRVKPDTDNLTLSFVAGYYAKITYAQENYDMESWSYMLEDFWLNGNKIETRIAYVHESDLCDFCL